ncbi:hypothetical protein [Aurantimicrobium minutum]|uniref:hypothetical protein n=1 Tax=Aurantimicrobium minutum TaxID=708131 RepID=UPI002475E194|nr:hypothetical protein [Aurantimicrobium minutum]MDH6535852.1 hypothetical protein [Aurantimicrobium minutum]
MKRLSVFPALFAMVTVAFLFGLAPVFHAVCVSAMSPSSTADMSHVMADGTVMEMTAEVPPAVMNMSSSGTEVKADAISNPDMTASNFVGSIMITAGLTLLTFFGLRYCKQALARGFVFEIPKSMLVKLSEVSLARARPPSHVDLNSLCISRT